MGEISKKMQESRLKWWACIEKRRRMRRQESDGVKMPGGRRRGRPKRRWLDSIRNDLSERELSGEDA